MTNKFVYYWCVFYFFSVLEGRGRSGYLENNLLGQRREPKTTQPHMASTPEFEPGSSALITTPFLLPLPLQFLLSQEVMASSISTRKKGANLGQLKIWRQDIQSFQNCAMDPQQWRFKNITKVNQHAYIYKGSGLLKPSSEYCLTKEVDTVVKTYTERDRYVSSWVRLI